MNEKIANNGINFFFAIGLFLSNLNFILFKFSYYFCPFVTDFEQINGKTCLPVIFILNGKTLITILFYSGSPSAAAKRKDREGTQREILEQK